MSPLPEDVLPTGTFVTVEHPTGPVRLHLHDVGAGDDVVLFLHGSGPGASGWSNFMGNASTLAEHGVRCLLPDLVGYGRSDMPTDRPYDFDLVGGTVVAMLDALGIDRVVPVGNSMGGAVAIWLALHHPDRVAKLVLMAPGGLESRETYMEMRGIRSMMRALYGPEGLTAEGMRLLFAKQVVDPGNAPPETIDARFAVAQRQPLHVFKTLAVPDQSERLGEIACPTLCFWGMDDLFCPPSGALKVAERVPDARVVLLTRCGHWVMAEHADTFDRLTLDFLHHG